LFEAVAPVQLKPVPVEAIWQKQPKKQPKR
jgi:hypothetical protein